MTPITTADRWYLGHKLLGGPPLKRGVPGENFKRCYEIFGRILWKFCEINQTNGDTDEASRKKWIVFQTMSYQVALLWIENDTSCCIDCYKKLISISAQKWNSRWKTSKINGWLMEVLIYDLILGKRIL